jgi:hypothetical protein
MTESSVSVASGQSCEQSVGRVCMRLRPIIMSEGDVIWLPIRGPKWPGKLSPGFTLGNSPTRISPEGATRRGESRLRTFASDRVRISCPFWAVRGLR